MKFLLFVIPFFICSLSLKATITILTPTSGEYLKHTDSYQITWTDNISSNVDIFLYENGAQIATIASGTPSDGSYMWYVPYDYNGNKYTIFIRSSDDHNDNDESADYFYIGMDENLSFVSGSGNVNINVLDPVNEQSLASFLIQNNNQEGFYIKLTFENKGKFKNGASEVGINSLVLRPRSGVLGDGLIDPGGDIVVTLDVNGEFTYDFGNTQTTQTINYQLDLIGICTSNSNSIHGFFKEKINFEVINN